MKSPVREVCKHHISVLKCQVHITLVAAVWGHTTLNNIALLCFIHCSANRFLFSKSLLKKDFQDLNIEF